MTRTLGREHKGMERGYFWNTAVISKTEYTHSSLVRRQFYGPHSFVTSSPLKVSFFFKNILIASAIN